MDVVSLIIHPYYASGVRKRAILWNWHKIWLAVEDPFITGITPIYSNITQERSVQLALPGARGDQSPRLIFHSPPASRDCVEFQSHSPGRKLRHNRALFISSSKVTVNSLLIKVWFFFRGCECKETWKLEYRRPQKFNETFQWNELMEKKLIMSSFLSLREGLFFFVRNIYEVLTLFFCQLFILFDHIGLDL